MEMTDEEKKELRAIIRETVMDALEELRHMPVPASRAPITEITIRISSGEMVGISTLGVGALSYYCMGPTGPGEGEPYTPSLLDDRSKEILQRIMEMTGEAPEEIIRKVIRTYANELAGEPHGTGEGEP